MENPFSNLGKGAIKVASEVLANAKYAFPAASAIRPAPSWASTNSNCRCPSTWKRTQRDTTMLNDVCVPCALICMLDAAVSILVQAVALCCSWRLCSVSAWLIFYIPEHAVLTHMERKSPQEHTLEDSMRTN